MATDSDWWMSDAWQHVEFLSIRDAAFLLSGAEPVENNRVLPNEIAAMQKALEQAVIVGRLPPYATFEWQEDSPDRPEPITSSQIGPHTHLADSTTVLVDDLIAWCEGKRIPHMWNRRRNSPMEAVAQMPGCPAELRAAIEAFTAVYQYPAATATRSPKNALLTWLEQHKPDLSSNARERVATVANWQPTGGAPKTPG